MKTIAIFLLILIVFPLEILLTICTVTIYMFVMKEYGEFLTEKLINKL